ncbi:MAG: hypothetical protein WAO78_14630 [Roseovarius sp.]
MAGITGLASARIDWREARLDRIYAVRRSFCWDIVILWQTAFGTRF